ncbi:uncharacterized protein MAM_03485 [Metarhizium album ARSEF 1941]|uniref:Uncharacterized protein n=1 Tax=Metarhizium album (strain ARSEF 1941) TaxID=1081103 RepID=A0A0B2WQM2_METAS|nr:uncharacterized protein MAM_03485 [Metarhizium album ARSEF 1941]KHN98361.1 hypothetical protein MAM_03485 [Metarhizium album ARSEF 1941]
MVCAGYPQRVIWAADRLGKDYRSAPSAASASPPASALPSSLSSNAAKSQKRRRKELAPKLADGNAPSPEQDVKKTPTSDAATAKSESPVLEWRRLPAADQNSFITSLVAFCQHIISSDGSAAYHGRHLSSEAVRLISRLHDLMQARIEGRSTGPLAGGDTRDSVETARHRLAALIGLNEALEAANPFAFLGIAAFAVLEVCDSPFGEWQRHLHGAKSLLDCHCPDQRALERLSHTVTGLTDIVARLVWWDTLGAVARGSRGLIFDDWHRQAIDQSIFEVVGCSADTFDLFSRVAQGQVSTDGLRCCIMAVDQLAQVDSGESAWALSANVNRCASAIAVLAQCEDTAADGHAHRALDSAVERACQLISRMNPSSIYYIHVAVSAYLAGMHAASTHQCRILRAYWHHCNHAGVQRYPDGLAKCEERWRERGLAGRVE